MECDKLHRLLQNVSEEQCYLRSSPDRAALEPAIGTKINRWMDSGVQVVNLPHRD